MGFALLGAFILISALFAVTGTNMLLREKEMIINSEARVGAVHRKTNSATGTMSEKTGTISASTSVTTF